MYTKMTNLILLRYINLISLRATNEDSAAIQVDVAKRDPTRKICSDSNPI
jgi:hypothetical protein